MIKVDFEFNKIKRIYEELIITPKISKEKNYFSKFKKQLFISQINTDIPAGILLEDSYIALLKTMLLFNEKSFCCLITEGKETNKCNENDSYFLINKDTDYKFYKKYIEENFIFEENILFSLNKNWSLLLTQDFFGILAGTDAFIEQYKKNYPKWKNDALEVIKTYKNSSFFLNQLLPVITEK